MDPRLRSQPDTTIVGARPRKLGSFLAQIPRGIEVLIRKAAVDAAFRDQLIERRGGAASQIGLSLSSAERGLLAAVPAQQLRAVIDATEVEPHVRQALLGRTAAVMLAALSAAPAFGGERAAGDASHGAHVTAQQSKSANTPADTLAGEAAYYRRLEEAARKVDGDYRERWRRVDSIYAGEQPAESPEFLSRVAAARQRELQRLARVDSLAQDEKALVARIVELRDELDSAEGTHSDSVLNKGDNARTTAGREAKDMLDLALLQLADIRSRLLPVNDPGSPAERPDPWPHWRRGPSTVPPDRTVDGITVPAAPPSEEPRARAWANLEDVLADRLLIRNADRAAAAAAAVDSQAQAALAQQEDEQRADRLDSLRRQHAALKAALEQSKAALRKAEGGHADTVLQGKGAPRTRDGQRAKRAFDRANRAIPQVISQLDAATSPVSHMQGQSADLSVRFEMQDPAYGTKGMRADVPNTVQRWLRFRTDSLNLELARYKRRHSSESTPEPVWAEVNGKSLDYRTRVDAMLEKSGSYRDRVDSLAQVVSDLGKESDGLRVRLAAAEKADAEAVLSGAKSPRTAKGKKLKQQLGRTLVLLSVAQDHLLAARDTDAYIKRLTAVRDSLSREAGANREWQTFLRDTSDLKAALDKAAQRQARADSLTREQTRLQNAVSLLRDKVTAAGKQSASTGKPDSAGSSSGVSSLARQIPALEAKLSELRRQIDETLNPERRLQQGIRDAEAEIRKVYPKYGARDGTSDRTQMPGVERQFQTLDSLNAELSEYRKHHKILTDFGFPWQPGRAFYPGRKADSDPAAGKPR